MLVLRQDCRPCIPAVSNKRSSLFFNSDTVIDIIHGDFKPENIVVFSKSADSSDAIVKIIDFGCSSYGLGDQELVHISGTPLWSAPENNCGDATVVEAKKMDVYSFGLVCLWILCFDYQLPGVVAEETPESSMSHTKTARWTRRFLEFIQGVHDLGGLIPPLLKQLAPLETRKHAILEKFFVQTLCKDPKNRPHDWSEYMLLLGNLYDMRYDRLCITTIDPRLTL